MSDSLPPFRKRPIWRARGLRLSFIVLAFTVCSACAAAAPSSAAAGREPHSGPTPTSTHPSAGEWSSNQHRRAVAERSVHADVFVPSAAPPEAATVSPPGVEQMVATSPVGGMGHRGSQSPTAPLSDAVIQSTLRSNQAVIKHRCWAQMQEHRALATPSTARVTLTLVIAPTGTVESVRNVVDEPGYRGLGACIAAMVRDWSFPPAPSVTETTIAFVFVAQ